MRFAVIQIVSMIIPLFVGGATILSLSAWWYISKYHLPVSRILAFMTSLLPVVNFLSHKYLIGRTFRDSRGQQRVNITPLAALVSILVYSLNIAVLALSTTYFTEPTGGCLLRNQWQGYFRAKAGKEIREVQDLLDCCGLASLTDMPYPFPRNDTAPMKCAKMTERKDFCLPAWSEKMRTFSGMLIGADSAVILVSLVALLTLLSKSPRLNKLLYSPFSGPRDYQLWMREEEDDREGHRDSGRVEEYHDDDDGDDEDGGNEGGGRGRTPPAPVEGVQRRAIASHSEEDRNRAESQRLLEHSTSTPDHVQ